MDFLYKSTYLPREFPLKPVYIRRKVVIIDENGTLTRYSSHKTNVRFEGYTTLTQTKDLWEQRHSRLCKLYIAKNSRKQRKNNGQLIKDSTR